MIDNLSPWQRSAFNSARSAWQESRLSHALLLCGPAQLGKTEVTQLLAHSLLCHKPVEHIACGQCRSCKMITAATHPDLLIIGLEENERTGKLRNEIVIEQIRRLSAWFALTPQFGGNQVAILAPADAMNTAAANALLKTLEEPASNRYLLLVSANPGRLPATIRSRCQRLEFRLPDRQTALQWLQSKGHQQAQAIAALDAAQGHPGLADQWLGSGGLESRAEVLRSLATLAQSRASPVELAQAWLADQDASLRLQFASELALTVMKAALGLTELPRGLSLPAELPKLTQWFDQINQLREQLTAPIRHDLLLAGLLGQWRSIMRTDVNRG